MRASRRVLLFLLACLPLRAGAVSLEMAGHLQGALDDLYNMKFADSETSVQRAIAVDPEHPYGHFGLAAVTMIQYIYGSEQADPGLLKSYAERTDIAIEKGSAWVKKHPQDAEGFMALGAAYGVSSRLLTVRRQWITAYLRGRKAVAYLQKAAQLDPDMGEPWLGLGMYDYYTDAYPRVIRVLAKLFLHGNRERGVAELRRSLETGRFSQVVAKMILVEIFLEDQWGLRDPAEAVKFSAEIRQRYPNSAMVVDIDFIARYEAGLYTGLLPDVEAFNERARKGEFDAVQLAKGLVIKATALWALNRHVEALESLEAASQVKVDGKITRWGVWADIRAGNLLDSIGRRPEALAKYKAAAALPDLWDLRQFAKAGLHEPWKGALPGHISPFGA